MQNVSVFSPQCASSLQFAKWLIDYMVSKEHTKKTKTFHQLSAKQIADSFATQKLFTIRVLATTLHIGAYIINAERVERLAGKLSCPAGCIINSGSFQTSDDFRLQPKGTPPIFDVVFSTHRLGKTGDSRHDHYTLHRRSKHEKSHARTFAPLTKPSGAVVQQFNRPTVRQRQ